MMPTKSQIVDFVKAFKDLSAKAKKVDQSHFRPNGDFPIIDQGQEFIAGYIDNPSLAWKGDLPVIIFGDHTRILKYVDFPFVLGADGTKVLMPLRDVWPKYGYYALCSLNIPSVGYSRHFKFLKEARIPLPPLAEQQRIADILSRADRLRRLRRYALEMSDGYLQAVFLEMFGDPVTNPMGWEVVKFDDVCDSHLGKMLDAKQQTGKHLRPYLRNVNRVVPQ